jgi:multidrug efflux system outer membrane protein
VSVRRRLVPLVAVLVAGCMVGPDYQRPAVPSAERFLYEPRDAAQTADTAWWRQFGDPVLDKLVDEALANNRNVKIAAANVDAAAAVLTQARSPLYPQLGYGGAAQRQRAGFGADRLPNANLPDALTAYDALLSASWELDLWGRIRRQSEAARANVLATDEARRGVILSLVASVAGNYLQLRGLDAQLAVAKQTLGAYGESVKLFELQFQYGQVSQMNVAQAKSQYETAAAQIPLIESQIAQAEDAISILLARNPGPIERGKTIDQLAIPTIPAGLPSQLLERRPDVMQAEQQLVAANAQIGAAKALYFPTISLTGTLGTASRDLSDLFKGPSRTWSYAGQLVGPIFTAGAISGQVAQAQATQQAAVLNYQQSVQSAFADVDNALVAHQKILEQLAAQQRLVAALQDYTRLARLQYDAGYSPYSTVLQAEQALFPAELQLAAVRASSFSSATTIYKAMGGGWIDVADRLTGPGTPAVERANAAQPLL